VALIPSQYQRIEPYRSFITALEEASRAIVPPDLLPVPPFLDSGPEARF
jgi:hypothetical protein